MIVTGIMVFVFHVKRDKIQYFGSLKSFFDKKKIRKKIKLETSNQLTAEEKRLKIL